MARRKIIPYRKWLKAYARELRNNSTKAEIRLWMQLKTRQLCGLDFDRQKPIDKYIVDFFCVDIMLAIEVDGASHDWEETQVKDEEKEARLNELGVTVLRFTDNQIFHDMDKVLDRIEAYYHAYKPTP